MPNQLKIDPTKTTMLRKRFVAEMIKRFRELSKAIQVLVVDDDAFGLFLRSPHPISMNVATGVWRFNSNAQKVKSFRRWLQQQVDAGILKPIGGISGKPWTATYIESAYKKGSLRAYTDLRAGQLSTQPSLFEGGRAEFIRTAFGQPEVLSKIELLYERAFNELTGVTASMSQQMSRTLADGLAQGHGPQKIARNLRINITKMTKTRASVIARTEIIRAHAEGQLDAFERLGVKEVGVMAEWSTAGDDRVCPLCGELEGMVMTVKEARGIMPRHPNCRCMWIPANTSRREKGQLWDKKKNAAIRKSIQAEAPKTIRRTAAEVRRRSVWTGKNLIPRKRVARTSSEIGKSASPQFAPKTTTKDLIYEEWLGLKPEEVRQVIPAWAKAYPNIKESTIKSWVSMWKRGKGLPRIAKGGGATPIPKPIPKPVSTPTVDIPKEISEAMKKIEEGFAKDFKTGKKALDEVLKNKTLNKKIGFMDYRKGGILEDMVYGMRQVKGVSRTRAHNWLQKVMDKSWGKKSLSFVELGESPNVARSFHNFYGTIMSPWEGASTFIHEFGHFVEQNLQKPKIQKMILKFLKRRVKFSRLVRLADVFPKAGYKLNEYAFKDDFDKLYTGKGYGATSKMLGKLGKDLPISTIFSRHEVISMGMQKMYTNPHKFFVEDKDFFELILRVIKNKP